MVHSFDDLKIIAGAGTVGHEILDELPDVDMIVAGVGGGGLLSGIADSGKAVQPAHQGCWSGATGRRRYVA